MVADVQPGDEGVYTCEVHTQLDMAEASGSITIVGAYTCSPGTGLKTSGP